jgi:hypothetical protein
VKAQTTDLARAKGLQDLETREYAQYHADQDARIERDSPKGLTGEIPIIGSAGKSYARIKNGEYAGGAFYAVNAVLDVGMVKAAVLGAGKLVIKGAAGLTLGAAAKAGAKAAAEEAIKEGEVTTFQDFVDRSVVGDNLEGHELWQHANLKANNLATTRLSTAASRNNPVMALDRGIHQQVNAAQRSLEAAAMTPRANISANAAILRKLNVASAEAVDQLEQMAIEHAQSLGF